MLQADEHTCSDCKFMTEREECTRDARETMDLVTGKPTMLNVRDCREERYGAIYGCGITAKFFEPKEAPKRATRRKAKADDKPVSKPVRRSVQKAKGGK